MLYHSTVSASAISAVVDCSVIVLFAVLKWTLLAKIDEVVRTAQAVPQYVVS